MDSFFFRDLQERFEGTEDFFFGGGVGNICVLWDLNDQTIAFACIYDVFSISEVDIRNHANTLAELYNVDADDFIIELLSFRGRYQNKIFRHFSDFAKFILTQLSENEFPLLQFFVSIILILPFAKLILSGLSVPWIAWNQKSVVSFEIYLWIYS